MIKRLVKLTIDTNHVDSFMKLYEIANTQIIKQNGCSYLSINKVAGTVNEYFTFSIWASHQDLDHYKKTELFKTTWKAMKVYFIAPAQAWSLELIEEITE